LTGLIGKRLTIQTSSSILTAIIKIVLKRNIWIADFPKGGNRKMSKLNNYGDFVKFSINYTNK
jgi:hypothetical protein